MEYVRRDYRNDAALAELVCLLTHQPMAARSPPYGRDTAVLAAWGGGATFDALSDVGAINLSQQELEV